MKKKVFIASDHAGYEYKNEVIKSIPTEYEVINLGPNSTDSVDYPDFATEVCKKLKSETSAFGILICGSGQGMALRANKYPFIRAALVYNDDIAKLAREHNDANVLCIGSRFCSIADAKRWILLFLNTPFAGGRHQSRVAKIGSDIS